MLDTAHHAILKELRKSVADLLSRPTVSNRFHEKVIAFCKPEAEADLRKSQPVAMYTDDEGRQYLTYEGGGPLRTPLGRLIVEGPKSLDAAYVFLALLHDSGPHVLLIGHAAPDRWWTYSAVQDASDPLDLVMALEWKTTLQWSMHEMTPEAIEKLSGWWKTVEAECTAIKAPVGAGQSNTAKEGFVANPVISVSNSPNARVNVGSLSATAAGRDLNQKEPNRRSQPGLVKQFYKKWRWLGATVVGIAAFVAAVIEFVKWFQGR